MAKRKRAGTKRGMTRKTARKAYLPRRRRAKRNPTAKEMTSVLVWGAGAAIGGSYVSRYLSTLTPDPMVAEWGTTLALGALGWWLTMKARTTPAGYAVLGIAMSHAAESVAKRTAIWPESGQNFVNRSKVVRKLPKTVSVQAPNPIGSIVVPA